MLTSALSSVARISLCRSGVGGLIGQAPGVRAAYGRWALYRRNVGGVFNGCFGSWDEAMAAIPSDRLAGWDHDAAAAIFDAPLSRQPSVYASMFWLSQLLRPGDRIVDLGGGAAITHRLHTARAPLPGGVRWTVVETPAVARFGAGLVEKGDLDGVAFVDSLDAAGACDVFFSAGAMQYMPDGLATLKSALAKRPRAIVLNKLPLAAAADYWTLQNFGPAICPYRVWRRSDFIAAVTAQGYVLKDAWDVAELACDIPFHPELCVRAFAGLTFVRTDLATSQTRGDGTAPRRPR